MGAAPDLEFESWEAIGGPRVAGRGASGVFGGVRHKQRDCIILPHHGDTHFRNREGVIEAVAEQAWQVWAWIMVARNGNWRTEISRWWRNRKKIATV